VIFGYDVGDICEHLLEKIWNILAARSLETRLWTGGIAAKQNWQPEKDWVYLDFMEWEGGGEYLGAGVWWKGLFRPPFIGQEREREDINEQEWPAMKVLQIDH
jgi:hypothetical protein